GDGGGGPVARRAGVCRPRTSRRRTRLRDEIPAAATRRGQAQGDGRRRRNRSAGTRRMKWLAAAALTAILAAITPARAETVDLLLILAADVSRSIDDVEFNLQRKGYAA